MLQSMYMLYKILLIDPARRLVTGTTKFRYDRYRYDKIQVGQNKEINTAKQLDTISFPRWSHIYHKFNGEGWVDPRIKGENSVLKCYRNMKNSLHHFLI